MGKGKNGIPDRWLPYLSVGSVIPGTRFIACKVPLKEVLTRGLKEDRRFGPKDLLDACPRLGLLIDLTNTTRYYDKEEITSGNVQYEKIDCPGWILPSNSNVNRFFEIVDRFLNANENNDRVIAVHCTHGVNRTGYFICRYMIQKLNMSPIEALERFRVARGHGIERTNYSNDLLNGCRGGSEANLINLSNQRNAKRKEMNEIRRHTRAEYEVGYSNWRLECNGGHNSRGYHEPPDGHRRFRWTPDNGTDSPQPPLLNSNIQKMFTPQRQNLPFSPDLRLPHYGISTYSSYERIRDDDQWVGGSPLLNHSPTNYVCHNQGMNRRRLFPYARGQAHLNFHR